MLCAGGFTFVCDHGLAFNRLRHEPLEVQIAGGNAKSVTIVALIAASGVATPVEYRLGTHEAEYRRDYIRVAEKPGSCNRGSGGRSSYGQTLKTPARLGAV